MLGKKHLVMLSVALMMALFVTAAVPAPTSPTPDGFDKFMVFMMDGFYNPNDPDFEAPDGLFFQKEIMGRSDAEILDWRSEAMDYFEGRYGVDFSDATDLGDGAFGLAIDGATLTLGMVDPRNEYRVYTSSGERVPSEGWVVRDGLWRLVFDEEVTLHGEWGGAEGKSVPAGGRVIFGEYNILRQGPGQSGGNSPHADPIIIHFRSPIPLVNNPDGSLLFRCELFSDEFGEGLAQGISDPQFVDVDGETWVQANVRNVLTFPGHGVKD